MSQIKISGLGENYKIIIMTVLLASAIILTYYFHAAVGIGTVFTHLFYIPIILASLWWKKKGVLVAVFLAIMLILSYHFLREDTLALNDYLRSLIFVIIAFIVALLSSQIAKMEKLLRQNGKWLSTTLKSIGDAVIAADMKGHVTFLNPVAENLTGWKHEDAIGKPVNKIFNIINEETGKLAENPVEKVLREGIIVGLANHTALIAKDGTKYSIDDSGAPIIDDKGNIVGVVLVFHDITERKKAEERLQLLSSIAKQTSEGMALMDLDGNLQFVNSAFAEMHGYSPEELLGKNLSIFHTPEQMPSVETANRQIKETGKFKGEIWHVRRDGTVFPSIMNNSLFHDKQGKAVGMIGVVRDITIRKRAEQALLKEKETAQRYFDVAKVIL
ncbi:MAG TPA: PAS domain S-box protein, partial [Methylophaga sp.]|nr:PAS domain S-box protein [Methylophaga sp.]